MSPRTCVLLASGLLGTAVVTACTGGPAAPHQAAPHRAAGHHVASGAVLPPPVPVTRAEFRHCPKTIPSRVGPPGTTPADLFGWASSYGNGKLWVGGLGPGGVTVPSGDMVGPDGTISWKYGWWRKDAGSLAITGRRLDASAPPLRSNVPAGYGTIGFQASGVTFPTEGCWQVTGKTAHTTLTFVTFVIKKADLALISGTR